MNYQLEFSRKITLVSKTLVVVSIVYLGDGYILLALVEMALSVYPSTVRRSTYIVLGEEGYVENANDSGRVWCDNRVNLFIF